MPVGCLLWEGKTRVGLGIKTENTTPMTQYNAMQWSERGVLYKLRWYVIKGGATLPLVCRWGNKKSLLCFSPVNHGKYQEFFGCNQHSSSWTQVHWTRLRDERSMSFKNPVFISANGLQPHVKYGASFTFQDSRNLVSLPMSRGFTSQREITLWSAREITFQKWWMNFHLPKEEDSLPPSVMLSGWHPLPPITKEKKSLPFLDLFILCEVLSKWSHKMWMG